MSPTTMLGRGVLADYERRVNKVKLWAIGVESVASCKDHSTEMKLLG